jgi:hypothetical protein
MNRNKCYIFKNNSGSSQNFLPNAQTPTLFSKHIPSSIVNLYMFLSSPHFVIYILVGVWNTALSVILMNPAFPKSWWNGSKKEEEKTQMMGRLTSSVKL